MQAIDTGTLEVTELEEMLGRECGCEVWHTPGSCTVTVVARGTSCKGSVKMCENGKQWHLGVMEHGLLCAACQRKAADCWRIIPI